MSGTVKVRIACAVDPKGDWYALGYRGAKDHEVHSDIIETLESGEIHFWIEAELPLPEMPTVQGDVVAAEAT